MWVLWQEWEDQGWEDRRQLWTWTVWITTRWESMLTSPPISLLDMGHYSWTVQYRWMDCSLEHLSKAADFKGFTSVGFSWTGGETRCWALVWEVFTSVWASSSDGRKESSHLLCQDQYEYNMAFFSEHVCVVFYVYSNNTLNCHSIGERNE